MKHRLTPTRIIALGFLGAIIIGTAILMTPFSSATGQVTGLVDALFTATSSVCVTGLLTLPIYTQWSFFGQLIILLLIQIGGLGIITFTTIVLILMRRKIGLYDRILIQNAYNLDSTHGMVRMVKRIIRGSLAVEAVGAALYMPVFIPEYGAPGIWYGIFNSVSAFCNAGMDVLGAESLMAYRSNILVNLTTILLIILGGIGFPVWWYFADTARERRKQRQWPIAGFGRWPVSVKAAVCMTGFLLISGTLVTLCMEYNNPLTIGELDFGEKLMASFFQSVTWRTAGFSTIPQEGLSDFTALFGCILMFIGGSPSGTAGGIKTTTIIIILASVVSIMGGRKNTEIFKRRINDDILRRAVAIFAVSFTILMADMLLLSIFEKGNLMDIAYEVVSALGTVGLSRGYTGMLSMQGRLIIIFTMYIGRIGPISLAMFFNSSSFANKITYPEEKISVG